MEMSCGKFAVCISNLVLKEHLRLLVSGILDLASVNFKEVDHGWLLVVLHILVIFEEFVEN